MKYGGWWATVSDAKLAGARSKLSEAVAEGFEFTLRQPTNDPESSAAVSSPDWELRFGDGR